MSGGAWAPFRHPAYRGMWFCMLTVHVTNWTQQVGAASLMTALTESPAMAALVQSAATLPGLFVGLLGGVLADLLDRRRWLMGTEAGILLVALAAGLTVMADAIAPASLLAFTALMSIGFAIQAPATQAVMGELVPRPLMRDALALGGVAFNVSRVAGPALAGALVAAGGGTAVYTVVVAGSAAVVMYLHRMRTTQRRNSTAPPERLWSALRTGIRFVRHSPESRLQMRVAMVSLFCGSATWALLPVVARDLYHMGPGGYGTLLGALGIGGVLGVWVLSALRQRWRPPVVAAMSLAAFGVVNALLAAQVPLWVVLPGLVVGGMMWMSCLSSIYAEFQGVLPDWVRARAVSIYNMVYMFAMGVGAAVWGYLATHVNTPSAMYMASAAMLGAALWAKRQPEVAPLAGLHVPAGSFSEAQQPPSMLTELSIETDPVLVQTSYRVRADAVDDFLAAASEVGRSCRRNGAEFWRLYRDLHEPCTYVERYTVDSWTELQRQQERETQADRDLRRHLQSFLEPGTEPAVRHLAGIAVPQG